MFAQRWHLMTRFRCIFYFYLHWKIFLTFIFVIINSFVSFILRALCQIWWFFFLLSAYKISSTVPFRNCCFRSFELLFTINGLLLIAHISCFWNTLRLSMKLRVVRAIHALQQIAWVQQILLARSHKIGCSSVMRSPFFVFLPHFATLKRLLSLPVVCCVQPFSGYFRFGFADFLVIVARVSCLKARNNWNSW